MQIAVMARSRSMNPRIRSTFVTSMFIISLVLFFLGLFVTGAIYSNMNLEKNMEDFEMVVYLPDFTKEEKKQAFGDFLKEQRFTKDLRFKSKKEAAAEFATVYGDEAFELSGVNPLPASYNFSIKIDYVQNDSINLINKILEEQNILTIMDIDYPIDDIRQMQENTEYFIKIAFVAGLIVILVAFFIVNSTVRLSVYSKRMMIRSMQLIGATNGFIRRPFIKLGILQGLMGALVSILILVGGLYVVANLDIGMDDVLDLFKRMEFMVLLGGILIFGALLGWLSSNWAVNRFLNKNLDQLM